jgi:hypothetical protein
MPRGEERVSLFIGRVNFMSDQLEQAEADEVWLYTKLTKLMRKPQADDVDRFCDRVWMLISEQGVSVLQARSVALSEIFGGQ